MEVNSSIKCDCISYNQPETCSSNGKREIVLKTPPHIAAIIPSGKPDGICVDACIADVIQMLWSFGVETLGCCCGHNKAKPNVVINTSEDADRVKRLLMKNDGRDWDVMQWKLIKC